MFRIAFKRGQKGIKNRTMKFALHNEITHCELNFSDGTKAASWERTGTGIFPIDQFRTANEWEYIVLPYSFEKKAKEWFKERQGMPYNWPSVFGGIIFPTGMSGKGYTCSESCFLALKYAGLELPVTDPQRISPSDLYQILGDYGHRKTIYQ